MLVGKMDADAGRVRQVADRLRRRSRERKQKYLEMRNNLTRFFEWRGCPFPKITPTKQSIASRKKSLKGKRFWILRLRYGRGAAAITRDHKGQQREQSALKEMGRPVRFKSSPMTARSG